MNETDIAMNPQAMQGAGSPRTLYTFFLLSLCKSYFESMRNKGSDATDIEMATVALISFCMDSKERKRLFDLFDAALAKDPEHIARPSAYVVGELVSYLSSTLDLQEEVHASW